MLIDPFLNAELSSVCLFICLCVFTLIDPFLNAELSSVCLFICLCVFTLYVSVMLGRFLSSWIEPVVSKF